MLDCGADIEAPGAVIGGGTPLADARAFGNWAAAHRLVERGARIELADAATLGLLDRLDELLADAEAGEVSRAFWGACHGGRLRAAEVRLERGADIDWLPPWEPLSPLDAATRNGNAELITWLQARGAASARAS